MKNRWIALVCLFSASAFAQIGSYLGPGILSRGAGTIGQRSGQQVDLRLFADANAVYDNGVTPFAIDSKGQLTKADALYGVDLSIGAYGSHRWRQASLGLDYSGSFTHYQTDSHYDNTMHNLTLGYTYQKSRRLVFELREQAGTSSRGYGSPGFYGSSYSAVPDGIVNQSTLLFDNRTYYLQSGLDVVFIQSVRTIYTFGGDGYFIRRQAKGLAGMSGYNLHGNIQRRISKTRTIGFSYEHTHFDFAPAFGESDINAGQLFFSTSLGRRWTFSLAGGVFQSQVQGLQAVSLDPIIAALLGQSSVIQRFYKENFYPTGNVHLGGTFKTSSVGFDYSQTVSPGNGVYLTSRNRGGTASYSYTGIRRWNFGISGGYSQLESIGQGIQPYSQITGGAGFTYNLHRALHILGRYDARHQEIDLGGIRRTSYRATIGIGFSPGNVPLSLW